MSLVNESISAEEADKLRQNALAILLKKSLRIHVSSTTSAMVQHMATIEKNNPDFPHRLLLVATGGADQSTLNAFKEDFFVLNSLAPDIQLLHIDFRFIPEIPRYYDPYVPHPNDRAAMGDRKTLVVLMLFIIAFPRHSLPSGAWRMNCLELIAAFHNDMKDHCLRLFCDLASQEDIDIFDGLVEMTKGWIRATDEEGPHTPQAVGGNVKDNEMAAGAEITETQTSSSQDSLMSTASSSELEDEDTYAYDGDLDAYLVRRGDRAFYSILKNMPDEFHKALLRASKDYC